MLRDEDVFARAIELPLEQRAEYLAATCAGDAELQARVNALLGAHVDAASFLEKPSAPFAAFAMEEKVGSPGTELEFAL